jgi:Xaa-Pro aminopeptidase
VTGGTGAGRHAERLNRAARLTGEAGLGALLVTPGPDLFYLTGHAPPPLERLTLLVIAPGRNPVLLVPLLERPAALASPAADQIEVLGWADGEDAYAVGAGLLPPGRLAVTDQTWASHVLGLQESSASRTFVTAGRAMPPLRGVKDEEELAALGEGGGGAPPPRAPPPPARLTSRGGRSPCRRTSSRPARSP